MMSADSLAEILAKAGSEEHRRRALEKLAQHINPTYGADPARPGAILEHRQDGTVRHGRFVGRQFVPSSVS